MPVSPLKSLRTLGRELRATLAARTITFARAKAPDARETLVVTPPGDVRRPGCLFCKYDDPASNRILCENDLFYARFDNYPASKGHVEIVPRRHVESFFDLTDVEVSAAYALLRQARQALDERVRPDAYTIGVNEGVAAGRSVHHLHIHLVPRFTGDVPDPRGGIRRALPHCDPDLWARGGPSPVPVLT